MPCLLPCPVICLVLCFVLCIVPRMFSWASLLASLGPLLACLRLPWASLGFCGALWGSLWLSWGPLGSLLAPPWPLLGKSWASLGRLLASLWRLFGLYWPLLACLFELPFSGPIFTQLVCVVLIPKLGVSVYSVLTFFGYIFGPLRFQTNVGKHFVDLFVRCSLLGITWANQRFLRTSHVKC